MSGPSGAQRLCRRGERKGLAIGVLQRKRPRLQKAERAFDGRETVSAHRSQAKIFLPDLANGKRHQADAVHHHRPAHRRAGDGRKRDLTRGIAHRVDYDVRSLAPGCRSDPILQTFALRIDEDIGAETAAVFQTDRVLGKPAQQ